MNNQRIVEAYIGEYASGKSELSINRALELHAQGHRVHLVDLDTVEPFYTLRPIREQLEALGLEVISYTRKDSFGLGETGAMLNPRARWALYQEGDIILDIGYGVYGAANLNLVEGIEDCAELQVIAVVNQCRPMTATVPDIVEYLRGLGRVDAIISNTHIGTETTPEVIERGHLIIADAARQLDLPIAAVTVSRHLKEQVDPCRFAAPLRYLDHYMPAAMW